MQLLTAIQKGWEAEIEAGLMNSALYPELGFTECIDGFAAAIPGDNNNTFRCGNVSFPQNLHAERHTAHEPNPGSCGVGDDNSPSVISAS